MVLKDPLEEIPTRAQVGYVLDNATVHRGELTPATVVGILSAKGVVDDPGDAEEIARSVMAHRGLIDGE